MTVTTSHLRRFLHRVHNERRATAAERLLPGPHAQDPLAAAEALREDVLRIRGFADVPLTGGRVPWGGAGDLSRSHLRQIHGQAVIRDLVYAFRRSHDETFIERALEITFDWAQENPRSSPAHKMAWHDHTTAMRTQAWLVLRRELLAMGHPASPDLDRLLAEHAALLASDWFHTAGTNHGMFQDEALVTYACLVRDHPRAADYFDLGTRRLVDYFDQMITADGVHREHAPGYHQLIARKLARVAAFYRAANARRTARHLLSLRRSMVRYSTHVIKPDGEFPLISDTFTSNHPQAKLFDDEEYRWAATGGAEGRKPRTCNVVFPDAGYAIFRDEWRNDGRGTYIHFAAAYHTDYHKHSDDLSVWIYHDGDLLTEAGPNGFDYADPFTSYGYSAHAHNTLLVDGESLPRVDDQRDEVGLTAWDADGLTPWARGRNGRFEDVVHEREVRWIPDRRSVWIRDEISSSRSHRYALLWNCAPGVVPSVGEDGSINLVRDRQRVTTLTIDSTVTTEARLLRGDIEGRRGFRLGGRDPVPTWTIEINVAPARDAHLVHTLQLA